MRSRERAGLLELRIRHIDADHTARPADMVRRNEGIAAGAAAQISDRLARSEGGEVEKVADARERLQRGCRSAIEIRERIPEPLHQSASHLEMEMSVVRLA